MSSSSLTLNLPLSGEEAERVAWALNVAAKAQDNVLAAAMVLGPIAVRIDQSLQAAARERLVAEAEGRQQGSSLNAFCPGSAK